MAHQNQMDSVEFQIFVKPGNKWCKTYTGN